MKKKSLTKSAILRRLKHMRKNFIGDIECLSDLIRDLESK